MTNQLDREEAHLRQQLKNIQDEYRRRAEPVARRLAEIIELRQSPIILTRTKFGKITGYQKENIEEELHKEEQFRDSALFKRFTQKDD
jgi:hypothetical protein